MIRKIYCLHFLISHVLTLIFKTAFGSHGNKRYSTQLCHHFYIQNVCTQGMHPTIAARLVYKKKIGSMRACRQTLRIQQDIR